MFVWPYRRLAPRLRLNPFEFRADVCLQTTLSARECEVLIPLNSGLMFVFEESGTVNQHIGLNPFEFRADVCHQPERIKCPNCLNPFEFRADVCLPVRA